MRGREILKQILGGTMGKILCLVHDLAEDLELWYPILRLQEEGYVIDLAGETKNHKYIGKYGVPYTSNLTYDEVNPDDYCGLLVPGGWAPDKIRRFDSVLEIVRHFDRANKTIGQICHAGWVLISADILKGRNVTSTPGIKDDMKNAGANWFDEEVVIDRNLVSARRPPDLPAYMKAFIKVLNDK